MWQFVAYSALLVIFIYLYLFPYWVARNRQHPQMVSLLVVNVAFGWTLIGWVGCLAWALYVPQLRKEEQWTPVDIQRK